MGAIRTLKDGGSNYTISSNVDGAVYSLIGPDCVIGGMGNEFELTYLSSSLNVSFEKGSQAIIDGNAFWLKDSVDLTLPDNATIYLCARIDSTKPNGQTGSFECLTADGMEKGHVNNGGKRDLLLYVITTGSSNITSISDKRNIVENSSASAVTGTLTAGSTSITLRSDKITSASLISIYTDTYSAQPTSVTGGEGYVTITFDAQSSNVTVGVTVDGSY